MFSNIEEKLERSIYLALRGKAIEFGYALDINKYNIDNDGFLIDEAEQKKYDRDLKTLSEEKGFAVEVFGYSSSHNIGQKKTASIVVEVESFLPGQTGLDTTPKYIKNPDGTYSVTTGPSLTSDLFFNIKLIARTVKQIRVLHQIKVNCLPRMGYMKWVGDTQLKPSHNLMVKYDSMADVSWNDEGIIEKVYRYEIQDAHELEDTMLNDNLPPIKEIDLDIDGKVDKIM